MQNKINYNVTNKDIEKLLGANCIIKYSNLANINNIDDIFDDRNFKIILIEEKMNSGHWTAILRYADGTIEQFDSYDGNIDSELKYISKPMRIKLNENILYLSNLLKNRKTISSKYRFQELKPGISTCGKHVLLRIMMFQKNYKLDKYIKWFKNMIKTTGLNGDELVNELVKF